MNTSALSQLLQMNYIVCNADDDIRNETYLHTVCQLIVVSYKTVLCYKRMPSLNSFIERYFNFRFQCSMCVFHSTASAVCDFPW